ncbi:MAG: thiamine-phosphate kinase [Puniceicoccaceae bacterium]|nr:MAG: thiamine-phosphate kinase [Puniceicoccaceae bacterium]
MFLSEPAVSNLTESGLIDRIARWLGPLNPPAPEGMGDDCAVYPPTADCQQIVTSDALVYGQHFDSSISARQAGIKLVNRNLSDIAAMGGTPERAILNLMCGPDLELAWLEAFFFGLRQAAAAVNLHIVGGDICRLNPGCFTSVLTIIGTVDKPLLRGTAQPGDAILVTGELGGSLAGKHAHFSPRLAEGRWLAQSGCCTALMDLTDGLAKDLPSLLAEDQTAKLLLDAVPLAADGSAAAAQSGRTPLEHAFCDGEDYELLFTLRAGESVPNFLSLWQQTFPGVRISHIGHISHDLTPGSAERLVDAANGQALPFSKGFEHFRGTS